MLSSPAWIPFCHHPKGFSDIGVGPEAPAAFRSGLPCVVGSYNVWLSRVMTVAMWRART
jgi:hypothetical protein